MSDLELLAQVLGSMFEPTLELAEEAGSDGEAGYVPAWGTLLEVERAPLSALGYLGNYVGVTIPAGATEAEARALVKAESGLARGTRASLEAAVRRILGAAPFTIQERTATGGGVEAYHFNILVGPGMSSQALFEAVNSVIPAGLWYSIIEVSGAWISGTKRWSEVAAGKKWSAIVEGEY